MSSGYVLWQIYGFVIEKSWCDKPQSVICINARLQMWNLVSGKEVGFSTSAGWKVAHHHHHHYRGDQWLLSSSSSSSLRAGKSLRRMWENIFWNFSRSLRYSLSFMYACSLFHFTRWTMDKIYIAYKSGTKSTRNVWINYIQKYRLSLQSKKNGRDQ